MATVNYKVRVTRRALLPSGLFGPDMVLPDVTLSLDFATGTEATTNFDGCTLHIRGVGPPGQIEYRLKKPGHSLQDGFSIIFGGAHLSGLGSVIRELTFTAVVSATEKYLINIEKV